MLFKVVYILFLGVILAAFIGIGIDTFYKAPKHPEYSRSQLYPSSEKMSEEGLKQETKEYDEAMGKYEDEMQIYNRNVSLVAIGFSILILIISMLAQSKASTVSDGLLLGGVLTLIYGIGRGMIDDDMFRFMVISVGLIVALILGYTKFILPQLKRR